MDGKWIEFESSTWFGTSGTSYELIGWKLFPDGLKVAVSVHAKKVPAGSQVTIVMGVPPREPGDEKRVAKPATKKTPPNKSSSLKKTYGTKTSSTAKTSSTTKKKPTYSKKTTPKPSKSSSKAKKPEPPPKLTAKVDFKRGKFITHSTSRKWQAISVRFHPSSLGRICQALSVRFAISPNKAAGTPRIVPVIADGLL